MVYIIITKNNKTNCGQCSIQFEKSVNTYFANYLYFCSNICYSNYLSALNDQMTNNKADQIRFAATTTNYDPMLDFQ